MKALARQHRDASRGGVVDAGILPRLWGSTNRHHTPYWGVLLFLVVSAAVITVAGGQDQRLVLFYEVSVFLSFLAGLVAMARFFARQLRFAPTGGERGGRGRVHTLAVNLARGEPIASLAAALVIAAVLYALRVRAGRPRGIRNVAADAEQSACPSVGTDWCAWCEPTTVVVIESPARAV